LPRVEVRNFCDGQFVVRGSPSRVSSCPRQINSILRESDDGWVIDPIGEAVTLVEVDYAFNLTIDELTGVRINAEFSYFDGTTEVTILSEDAAQQSSLATLHAVIVSRLQLAKSGVCQVDFELGRWVRVVPNKTRFETFDLHVPATSNGPGASFVGDVGGGLIEWSTDDPSPWSAP
jgi:hypothetical protein